MDGVLYYPHIEVPDSPWLVQSLLYWDDMATIVPTVGYELDATSLTRRLWDHDLLRIAHPHEVAGRLDFEWWSHLADLEPEELDRRQKCFASGSVTRLHVAKLFYSDGYEAACDLGLATRARDATHEDGESWVSVELRTAGEYMAALAMDVAHPDSRFAKHSRGTRWLPATDKPEKLLYLVGGSGRLPQSTDELHQSRLRTFERQRSLQAIVLSRLFPTPDLERIDVRELAEFKSSFGPELRAFRRHVEGRVATILAMPDVDQQVRDMDLLGDEFEDEIRNAEEHLRGLRVTRITRSTIVQLVRTVDPTRLVERVAKGAEDVVGGRGAVAGPLAYAAFARVQLLENKETDRPTALAVFQPPDHPLIDAFGYNAP